MEEQRDATPGKSPPKPKKRSSLKRKIAAGGMAALALTGGGVASRVINSQAAIDQNEAKNSQSPMRNLKFCDGNIVDVVKNLRQQGYNMFCIGDGDHCSYAASRLIHDLLDAEAIGVTDYFMERPEKDKVIPELDAALKRLPHYQPDGATQKWRRKVTALIKEKTEKGRAISTYLVDDRSGPDHHYYMADFNRLSDDPIRQIGGEIQYRLNAEKIIEGQDRDMVFRNNRMAPAIAETVADISKNPHQCCLFETGLAHLEGDQNMVDLLKKANIPGLKIAVIETLPIIGERFNEKVWRCGNQPDHFVVTYHDIETGKLLPPNHIHTHISTTYLFPPDIRKLLTQRDR